MKLLGWMHRKFRQNSGDTGRELGNASACLYSLSPKPEPKIHFPNEKPPSEDFLLNNLLCIGTFGSPIPIPTQNEIETTTESDLMAISAELEKVTLAETEKLEKICSGRPSQAGSNGKISEVFPLEDFVFGAAVETRPKQKRGSLGELLLFMRTGQEEENAESSLRIKESCSVEEMEINGGVQKGKICGAEFKLQNIMRIFQRKIHHGNSITSKKFTKPAKYEININYKCFTISNCSRKSTNDYVRQVFTPKKEDKKKIFSKIKECRAIVKNNSKVSREQWIKTDEDYLVLEL